MVASVSLGNHPEHKREPVNVRAHVSGLHPQSAQTCVTVEQMVRLDYAKTIAQWNDIMPEYKRWFLRQCHRYGLAPKVEGET